MDSSRKNLARLQLARAERKVAKMVGVFWFCACDANGTSSYNYNGIAMGWAMDEEWILGCEHGLQCEGRRGKVRQCNGCECPAAADGCCR